PPRPWPELATLGRREVTLGGRRGTLDIYHLPGTARYFNDRRAPDGRLGTFYEGGDPRKARRVNGAVRGRQVVLSLGGRWYTLNLGRDSLTVPAVPAARALDGWPPPARPLQSPFTRSNPRRLAAAG